MGSDAVQQVAEDRGHEGSVASYVRDVLEGQGERDVLKGPGEVIVLPKTMREDFVEQKEVLELESTEEQQAFWRGPRFGSSMLHLRPALQTPHLFYPSSSVACR